MTNCEAYWDLISAAVDGALTDEERARLDAHLAQCADCRQMYEQMMSMTEGLGDLESVPDGFLSGVMAEVERTEQDIPFTALEGNRDIHAPGKALMREWWRPIRKAAGLVACCLIVVGVWRVANWSLGGSSSASAPENNAGAQSQACADAADAAAEEMFSTSESMSESEGSTGGGKDILATTVLELEDGVYYPTGETLTNLPEGAEFAGTLESGQDYFSDGGDMIYVTEEDGYSLWQLKE